MILPQTERIGNTPFCIPSVPYFSVHSAIIECMQRSKLARYIILHDIRTYKFKFACNTSGLAGISMYCDRAAILRWKGLTHFVVVRFKIALDAYTRCMFALLNDEYEIVQRSGRDSGNVCNDIRIYAMILKGQTGANRPTLLAKPGSEGPHAVLPYYTPVHSAIIFVTKIRNSHEL